MIRVLIVDDHPVVRWGFQQMLQTDPEIEIAGELSNAEEALDRVGSIKPDVILLDVRMPGKSGLEIVSGIHQRSPCSRILILTVFDDVDHLDAALGAGVDGYLLKTASRELLLESIRTVRSGRRVMDPNLVHLVLDRFREMASERSVPKAVFSPEERRLLQLLASGTTVNAMAQELHLSVATVGRRLQQVSEKLRAQNRIQAVREATRLGLI